MPKACPVCGSRRWRRHGGVATCEEGHVLQNFRTEEAVLTEIGQHQLLRRRLRQNKAKALRRQVGEKDPDVFEGDAKHYLRLELFQLLLRHQLVAVQKAWGVPKEIENIARDLWILALEMNPIPGPPIRPDVEEDDGSGQAGPGPSTMSMAREKQSAYPSGSASQPLPHAKTKPQKMETDEARAAGDAPIPPRRKAGRPIGSRDTQPRKAKTKQSRPGEIEMEDNRPVKLKKGRPKGSLNKAKKKKVKIDVPQDGDVDMDMTSEDEDLGDGDEDETTEDDGIWTGEEDLNDEKHDEQSDDDLMMPDTKDYDGDDLDTDLDEYDYGEESERELELELDLLERVSILSNDDSDMVSDSGESIVLDGKIKKIPFANGKTHMMDVERPGIFISASGHAYGVKNSSTLKWSSGKHLKGISAETVLHILVLSLWIMRIPIMLIDVMRALDDGTIPYIEFGRSKYIPDSIKPHMSLDLASGGTWAKRSPSVYFFWERLKLFSDDLDYEKRIRIPELNAAPILWRLVATLGGGPLIYLVAYHILQALEMSLTISRPEVFADGTTPQSRSQSNSRPASPRPQSDGEGSATPADQTMGEERAFDPTTRRRKNWRGPKRGHGQSLVIEARMMAAVVIAFKLVYGLDGIERVPVAPDDPAVGLPMANDWVAEVTKKLKSGWFKRGTVESTPIDFSREQELDVDDFLARAEQFLLTSRTLPPAMESLAGMFPLQSDSTLKRPHDMTDEATNAWSEFHRTCSKIPAPSESGGTNMDEMNPNTLPLGARLGIYIAGRMRYDQTRSLVLPPDLSIVLEAASQIIGLRPGRLIIQISLMERTLYWAQQPYRAKRGPESERWDKYREHWEVQRQAARRLLEGTRWEDEDSGGSGSDLRSWHGSDEEEEDAADSG